MRSLSALFVAVALASSAAAHADPVEDEVKKHFGLGNDLYGEQRYGDALVEYDEAYRLSKNWRVLYNRGQCLVMLRREPEAIEAFEKYLAEGGEQVPEARRTAVLEDLEKLRARLGRVDLVSAPPNHDVLVDGRIVATTPLAKPLLLGAGKHEIAVRPKGQATGFLTSIDVVAGNALSVTVTMPDPPKPAPPPASEPKELGFHPTPAFDLSMMLGLSIPTTVFVKARLSALPFAELGASFRTDPLFEIGAYAGVAGGQLQLASDVASRENVEQKATYDYSMVGVRIRLHLARKARWDAWGGLEVAAWRETFRFTGKPAATNSFDYDATSIAPSLTGGVDFPIGKSWMIGGTSRLTLTSVATGSRNSCEAACGGDLPGTTSGFRSYFDFAGRLTWIVPL